MEILKVQMFAQPKLYAIQYISAFLKIFRIPDHPSEPRHPPWRGGLSMQGETSSANSAKQSGVQGHCPCWYWGEGLGVY